MRSDGGGTIEFLVVFLLFAALFLGLFEMTRLYRAKHVLNTAAFAAARAGSLHHARVNSMNAELANGMTPLLMNSRRSAADLGLARRRAAALLTPAGTGVSIVSPTAGTYADFEESQWSRFEHQASARWQPVLPNDNLRLRPRNPQMPAVSRSSPLNLQDANLLKIRVVWCHRIVTPVLDRLIFDILTSPAFVGERQRICIALSDDTTGTIPPGYYVAISADAIVRMQSLVSKDDLPAR